MGGLSFINAALLAGLGSLIVPVLIHLLLKQKRRPLRFSTVQFFLKRDEKTAQRRKLRNWLLLSLRLLLFALLVLAFARPYLRGTAAENALRRQRDVVVVLDRSASMQAAGRWSKAADRLREVVGNLGVGDRVALVDAGESAEVLAPLDSPEAIKPVLRTLGPGFGTSDLAAGLKTAVRLLAQSNTGGSKRIEVISDLQSSACAHLGEISVPKAIDLTLSPVAEPATPNLAVEELTWDQTRHAAVVGARNYSALAAPGNKLALTLDGRSVGEASFSLLAQTATQISLTLPRLAPGWHSVEARLAAHDGFALDDGRYLSILAPEPQRVLCLDPRAVPHVFGEETFFMASAFAPETNNEGPYIVEKATPAEAASRLNGAARYSLVVVPGLRELPAGLASAVNDFVSKGGGLILFAGEKMNASRYAEAWPELLPALPGHAEGDDTRPEDFWHLRQYDRTGPIFAAFKERESGDLSLPEFRHRFTLATRDGSHTLASFNDDVPLIVTRPFGHGCVVLVNTSADTAWTDWPKRKTFLPWLYGLAACAAQRTASADVATGVALPAGVSSDIPLGAAFASRPWQVRGPSGVANAVTSNVQGQISLSPERPGFYSIQNPAGQEVHRLVANLAASESDLQALAPVDLDIPRANDPPQAGLLAAMLGDDRREVWRFLLLAAVALLFLEPLLANRSYA